MSWFAAFNPQIDLHNYSVQLNLDDEQYIVIAAYTADSFSGIDLYTTDKFSQLLSNPKLRATAFEVSISHFKAPTSYSLMHVGTGHPSLSSCFSF